MNNGISLNFNKIKELFISKPDENIAKVDKINQSKAKEFSKTDENELVEFDDSVDLSALGEEFKNWAYQNGTVQGASDLESLNSLSESFVEWVQNQNFSDEELTETPIENFASEYLATVQNGETEENTAEDLISPYKLKLRNVEEDYESPNELADKYKEWYEDKEYQTEEGPDKLSSQFVSWYYKQDDMESDPSNPDEFDTLGEKFTDSKKQNSKDKK